MQLWKRLLPLLSVLIYGAIIAAASQSIATAVQAKQSRKAAKRNRNFQREMRNTQMQSRVKDLRLAGLNPILAAGGPGAASPAGTAEQVPDIIGATAKGVQGAIEALRLKSELQTQHSARGLLRAQTAENLARAEYNVFSAQNIKTTTDLQKTKLPAAKQQQEAQEKYPALKWINIIRRSITGASD